MYELTAHTLKQFRIETHTIGATGHKLYSMDFYGPYVVIGYRFASTTPPHLDHRGRRMFGASAARRWSPLRRYSPGEGRHRRDAVRREAREPAAGLVELVSSAGESKGPDLKMFCGFLWHFYSGKVQEDPLLGECIGVTCVFFLKQIQDGNPKVWKIYCWSMQWVQHSSHLCVDSVS